MNGSPKEETFKSYSWKPHKTFTLITKVSAFFLLLSFNLQSYFQSRPVHLDHAHHFYLPFKFAGRQHFPLYHHFAFQGKLEKVNDLRVKEENIYLQLFQLDSPYYLFC